MLQVIHQDVLDFSAAAALTHLMIHLRIREFLCFFLARLGAKRVWCSGFNLDARLDK